MKTHLATPGRVAVLGIASVTVGMGILINASATSSPSSSPTVRPATSSSDYAAMEVDRKNPCPESRQAPSLDDLVQDGRALQTKAFKPTMTAVCGTKPVVGYGDITVTYEDGWAKTDGDRYWRELAETADERVTTVAGRTAYLGDADSPGELNSVEFIVGDLAVTLIAEADVPIKELLALANDLELPTP